MFEGVPDTMKGSYYNNPQYDVPTEDKELIKLFPEYCHPNLWPSDDVLPELAPAFKDLGQLIVRVGTLVARQCDVAISRSGSGGSMKNLEQLILNSRTCKSRLLHYFPPTASSDAAWCGWHNDHGSLTGLFCVTH
jgi:hypothetical protein